MGCLLSNGLSADDSNQITISFWARDNLSESVTELAIMQWGEGNGHNSINLALYQQAHRILWGIYGQSRNRPEYPIRQDKLCDQIATYCGVLTPGAWFHFALAIDAGPDLSRFSASSTIKQMVNGASIAFGGYIVRDGEPGWMTNNQGTGLRLKNIVGVPWTGEVSRDTYGSAIQLAEFQLWYGTYIDPTVPANFANLVKISNGVGTPNDPSVAAAAFGTQTILFKGKASDASFFINQGNGGAFSKVGTATDFTPGPSY